MNINGYNPHLNKEKITETRKEVDIISNLPLRRCQR